MSAVFDHLIAVFVAGVVILTLSTMQIRDRTASVRTAVHGAAVSRAAVALDVVAQDMDNAMSKTLATSEGVAPYRCRLARSADGERTVRVEIPAYVRPAPGADPVAAHLLYTVVAEGDPVEVDGRPRPVYALRRAVDTGAGFGPAETVALNLADIDVTFRGRASEATDGECPIRFTNVAVALSVALPSATRADGDQAARGAENVGDRPDLAPPPQPHDRYLAMGRLLLLIVASAALSGALLFAGGRTETAEVHARSQNRALVRETADDALSTVLDDALDPRARRWRSRLTVGDEFEVDGHRVVVDAFELDATGHTATIGLTAYRGGVAHRTVGRYRIAEPDWPTALWVSAPYARATVDPTTVVEGRDPDPKRGTRPFYFDRSRFDAYRLDRVLSVDDLRADFQNPLRAARGGDLPLEVVSSMDRVLAEFKAPSVTELYGRALAEFDPSRDVRHAGGWTVDRDVRYGNVGNRKDPDSRIVVVDGPLVVPDGRTLRGNGIVVVRGDLTVEGTMIWDGLVLVMDDGSDPADQQLTVDLERGRAVFRGGLIVDQEAPPPGGHSDLTVNRDLSGEWRQPYGEVFGGTPAQAKYRRTYAFYQHTHRLEKEIGGRTIRFLAHDAHTQLAGTLRDIAARYPGERVYVRFDNHENHGASTFSVKAAGKTYDGAVGVGFGARARTGDSWASPAFLPGDLTDLTVDVRSLRLLAHLTDGREPASTWWNAGSSWWRSVRATDNTCSSRPLCIGYMNDRDGALTVQVVRDRNDAVLYEASVYWHTHADGQPEAVQEAAADEAWRTAIRAGTARYGAEIKIGKKSSLVYDVNRISGITGRLGFNALDVGHLGTFTEHAEVEAVHGRAVAPGRPKALTPRPTSPRPQDRGRDRDDDDDDDD